MNVVLGRKFVITDSGGLQEETTYLDIPCLTLRENTERPVTITQGKNRLVRAETMAENVGKILAGNWTSSTCPPLWDGQAAVRAVACLKRRVPSQKDC